MTLEQTLAQLLDDKLAPLVDANRRLVDEVARLRRALPTQLVTVPEAARALGLSTATIRRRIKDHTIPVRRVGRSIRIDLAAVQHEPEIPGEAIAALRQTTQPKAEQPAPKCRHGYTPRLCLVDPSCDGPKLKPDEVRACLSCKKATPHRFRPSPEAGGFWRCSECGGPYEPEGPPAAPPAPRRRRLDSDSRSQ